MRNLFCLESHNLWCCFIDVLKLSRLFKQSHLLTLYTIGNYKVEMFDEQKNTFVPTLVGLGMLVQVKDPEEKELLSRVTYFSLFNYIMNNCI